MKWRLISVVLGVICIGACDDCPAGHVGFKSGEYEFYDIQLRSSAETDVTAMYRAAFPVAFGTKQRMYIDIEHLEMTITYDLDGTTVVEKWDMGEIDAELRGETSCEE